MVIALAVMVAWVGLEAGADPAPAPASAPATAPATEPAPAPASLAASVSPSASPDADAAQAAEARPAEGTTADAGASGAPADSGAEACTELSPYRGQALEDLQEAAAYPGDTVHVGAVRVHRQPVFDLSDPEQNLWPYRMAMRLREWAGLDTRPEVIRDILFFREGDEVPVRTIGESERELRAQLFLYDARILPARRCGDRVDLDVVTRDLWTLLPRLDVSRSGGFSNFGIGLLDANVFGTGKKLSMGYRKTVDRRGVDIGYTDPNVAGSHHVFSAQLAHSDDGYVQSMRAELPFYSFASRFAWGAAVERAQREESLYFHSEKFAGFERRSEYANVFVGASPGLVGDHQTRVRVGFVHEEHRFRAVGDRPLPLSFPEDRVLDYPYLALERVEDDYELTRNLDRIQRTEDLYTGERFGARVGYSTQGANRWLYRLEYFNAAHFVERTILRYGITADGAWRTDLGRTENLEVNANVRLRDRQNAHWSGFASASFTWTDHLTADRQLLLGGDTGLRGYPLRYQLGDRRFLLSVEERYFSDLYIAKLVRVGGAVFADVGRAWFPDLPSREEFGVLADVGVGLRLESTRTQNGVLMHIDLAFPLVDGPEVDAAQFLIQLKQSL